MRLCWLFAILFLISFQVSTTEALAQRRLALVIGIDDYTSIPKLQKATGDARAMAATLEGIGFEVTTALNTTRQQLNITISNFTNKLSADDIAFVHFSGHGVEIDGDNFLLPADIPKPTDGRKNVIKYEAIGLRRLISQVGNSGARTRIFVVDACRDNPFEKAGVRSIGSTRGLSRIEAPVGTFIMYSAGYRQTALDRLGPEDNADTSVYTRVLLTELDSPGIPIAQIAREVRRKVQDLAKSVGHSQRPAYYDELSAALVLSSRKEEPGLAAKIGPEGQLVTPVPQPQFKDKQIELAYWNAVKGSRNADLLQSYLDRYPAGSFSPIATFMLNQIKPEIEVSGAKMEPAIPEKVVTETSRAGSSIQRKNEQIAALDPASKVLKETELEAKPKDNRELVREIQIELNRIGCSVGKADGIWGQGSVRGLRNYVRYDNSKLASLDPSREILETLRKEKKRVCPLICSSRHLAKGNRCVLKTCKKGQELSRSGNCVAKGKKLEKPKKLSNSSPPRKKNACGRCIVNSGNYYVCRKGNSYWIGADNLSNRFPNLKCDF